MRATFLIDGFNVYHSLKEAGIKLDSDNGTSGCKGTRWLDLTKLCNEFVRNHLHGHTLNHIQYFSAHATHLQASNPDVVTRHMAYIAALESLGVEPVLGKFKQARNRYEEKETDVAIAVHLMAALARDKCDAVVIVSGDTDLSPAIRVARDTFPGKSIGVLFPYKRFNRELAQIADVHMKAGPGLYRACQLPDPVTAKNGTTIPKPPSW